jgi:hypothetical protein
MNLDQNFDVCKSKIGSLVQMFNQSTRCGDDNVRPQTQSGLLDFQIKAT